GHELALTATEVFDVSMGPSGLVLATDTGVWVEETDGTYTQRVLPDGSDPRAIWGAPDGTLWVVSASDDIWRDDGNGFVQVGHLPRVMDEQRAITGADGTAVFLSNGEAVYRLTGPSLQRLREIPMPTMRSIQAANDTDLWVLTHVGLTRWR